MEDYKEKLELARDWYNDQSTTKKEKVLLENLFPELKESEDWIPKEIIKYLKEKGDFRSCWIAWLEKQHPKKHEKESENNRIKTNIIKLLRFVRDSNHQYSDECNESIVWLEKQSFVHPIGNVELKFKEEAIKKIQEAANNGVEEGHYDGDKVLCELLISLGYKEVVDEWNKLDKWYA